MSILTDLESLLWQIIEKIKIIRGSMNKAEFRKQQIDKLHDTTIVFDDLLSVFQQLFQSKAYQNAQKIGITLSRDFEIPTGPIIYQAQKQNKEIFIPKTRPDKKMIFVSYNQQNLESSDFGILEPKSSIAIPKEDLDLIIVPGVAVANDSNVRLGFGGGYYDWFLADYKGDTIFLATKAMLYESFPFEKDSYDIAVKTIISPK